MTYLNAVKAVGTTDADKVMEQLRKTKVDDMYTSDGIIRADGLLQHSMYVMQVKTPAESKGPWDYYKLVKTMSGEEAYGSLANSTCPAGQEIAGSRAVPRRADRKRHAASAARQERSILRATGPFQGLKLSFLQLGRKRRRPEAGAERMANIDII